MAKYSIIIAAYNEEQTISGIISDCLNLNIDKEVIVVNDGSTDKTHTIIKEFGDQIIYIDNITNKGKGYSMREGIRAATGNFLIFQDADNEYPVENIYDLIKNCELFDMVVGVRTASSIGIYRNLKLSSFIANKMFAHLIDVPDVFSGQRILRKSFADSMELTSNRFQIETEMTMKAKYMKAGMAFLPIAYHPRSKAEGKKIGLSDFISISTLFMKLKLGQHRWENKAKQYKCRNKAETAICEPAEYIELEKTA